VERILDSIVRTLHRGDMVEIRGFGTFGTRQRAPRLGRNPRTGVRVEVPAKRIPFFKRGKELRDVLGKL
jgi:integration host factor subunit beta